jgi:FkbH-like protein
MPRYRLGNIVYFIEQLNEHLYNSVIAYFNSYMLDIDEIISVYGRRHYQNDVVHISNDGGALSDFDFNFDKDRIQNIVPISDIYPSRVYDYILHTIREIHAIYKTISQVDSVKLVIVDLDDTLWRGIAAERTDGYFEAMEGWPLGLIEALGYLKKRGVLLAIVSKNGHEKIERIWPHLAGHERLPLSDFSICRINWKPKADNIEEILGIINILPRNVVFIDDNPVERESVKAAFPKIRTFGPNPYLWRRVLLWSPETQVAAITNESASRTEMIQSQVLREEQRKILSRSEFLKTLQLSIIVHRINEINDRHFPRAFELINKSNQFNTTGKRWTSQQFSQYFAGGGCIYSFEVEDRFTKYGSVGSVVVRHSFIEQFVMSCRVLGMEVEIAVVANISNYIESAGDNVVTGQLIETDANGPCRDLYSRCGFTVSDKKSGKWSKARYSRLEIPEHINFLSSEI